MFKVSSKMMENASYESKQTTTTTFHRRKEAALHFFSSCLLQYQNSVLFSSRRGEGQKRKVKTDEEKEIHCLDISRHEHEHHRSVSAELGDIRSMTMTFRIDETSDNCGFCGVVVVVTVYMVDTFRYWEGHSNF